MTLQNDGQNSRSPYAEYGPALIAKGYAALPVSPSKQWPCTFERGSWTGGMPGWAKTYIDKLPTPAEIARWSQWPGAGVAVVCGKASGDLIAFDIDTDDEAIIAAILAVIPPSPVAKRGSKGRTLFYHGVVKSPPFNANDGKRLIDILGEGKQTVLPPSNHCKISKPYHWIDGSRRLDEFSPDELPELTEAHIDAVREALVALGVMGGQAEHAGPHSAQVIPLRPTATASDTDKPHRQLNELALAKLDAWVPDLKLYKLERTKDGYKAVATWRLSSTGRPTEQRRQSLSIHHEGITDFGADRKYTALNLVKDALGVTLDDAFEWLSQRVDYVNKGNVSWELPPVTAQANDEQGESPQNDNPPGGGDQGDGGDDDDDADDGDDTRLEARRANAAEYERIARISDEAEREEEIAKLAAKMKKQRNNKGSYKRLVSKAVKKKRADIERDEMQRKHRARVNVGSIFVDGVEKRITNIGELNESYGFLKVKGQPSAYVSVKDAMPIATEDLKRRLECEVIVSFGEDGKTKTTPAFDCFKGDVKRRTYDGIAFTGESTPPNIFNLYAGLGVTPKKGEIGHILQHIEEVLCSGDKVKADKLVKLMAWQIQNIGKPSRVVVLLYSEKHQVGKGIILERLLLPIYGVSGASIQMNKIEGQFNDLIRGKAFALLDEVSYGGNRKGADIIKTLSTALLTSLEAKYISAFMCPVALNIWMLSNHSDAAHIEVTDVRYVVLEVSGHRQGDFDYFAVLLAEINNGGLEAFAHHILTLDVSDFAPQRDAPESSALKTEMKKKSANHLDVRHWLEECYETEIIAGHYEPHRIDGVPYRAGATYSSAALFGAYKNWQQKTKGPKAANPMAASEFGKALTRAGFGTVEKNSHNERILPDPATALGVLWDEPTKPKIKLPWEK